MNHNMATDWKERADIAFGWLVVAAASLILLCFGALALYDAVYIVR